LRALREDILLVSLLFFNISEGFKVMMIILISKARMAITINSSIRVKLLVLFTPLDRFIGFFLKNPINLFCEAELSNGVRVKDLLFFNFNKYVENINILYQKNLF
jgi:hypothetical protein